MMRRLVSIVAAIGAAALLGAGYAAAGATGLADMAAIVAVAALLLARRRVRGGKAQYVMPKKSGPTAVSQDDFPSYTKIASDLEWGVLSRRHYQHMLRPYLAHLAAALPGRTLPELDGAAPGQDDDDGPGPSVATLDRIITQLERQ
jgi:hypothetical protein